MSKGFLLNTVDESNIVAPVPEEKIWLFASESNGKPVIKGKLPDGSFLTFGGAGGTGAFYQCASVDTAAGTWTGYKWEWDNVDGYYLGELKEGMTYIGFVPEVMSTYSEDTLIICQNLYSTEPTGDIDPVTFTTYACPVNPTAATYEDWIVTTDSHQDNADHRAGYQAFDDTNIADDNYWHSYGNYSISSANPAWIQWQNTKEKVLIQKYAITSTNRNDCRPVQWQLQGSNDGVSWITLDDTGKNSWNPLETIYRGIQNVAPYYYHRLLITRTTNDNYCTIALIRAGTTKTVIDIADTISLTFKLNESISHSLDAKDSLGNACTYEIVSGTLPTGVEFDSSTGAFSGTPTAEETVDVVIKCITNKAEKEVTVSILVTSRTSVTVSGINYTSYSCPINPTDYSYENWVISASTELGDWRSAYNAFYDWETLYEEQAGWCSANVDGVAYLQWQNTVQPVLVNAYSMTNVERSNCLPTAWTFEGSNDGTSWTVLDTVAGHSPTSGETIHRILANTTSYSYYRVNVTAVNDWGYVTIGLLRAGVGDAIE